MPRILLAFVLLLSLGCEAGSGSGTDERDPEVAGESQILRRAGVSIRLPEGWHETRTATDRETDPVVRLAVSSGPIRPGGGACRVSAYDFPADAVAIVLVEWRSLEVGPPQGPVRPDRFTESSLPISEPPSIECFGGAGGSAQFVEAGRVFGAYVLVGLGARPELRAAARAVLDTLRVELELPRPIDLVELPPPLLAECRRSALVRPACPARVPRVRGLYRSQRSRDVLRPARVLDVFDLERAPDRDQPDENRPPRFAHIGLLAGEARRIGAWVVPRDRTAFVLRDGLMLPSRTEPISFGHVRWGETRGLLFLAPPFPAGGYLADHLAFVWQAGGTRWVVSLHAWEPLRQAVATLRAMKLSA